MDIGLPFTANQFLAVMADYNVAAWPVPPILWLGAVANVVLLALRGPAASRVVSAFLAMLWLWMAMAYHLAFFARVNAAAPIFAALFGAAAVLFAWHGVIRRRLVFRMDTSTATLAGLGLVVLALVGYPLLALSAGHAYPAAPTFGLPCPTTLYTVGILAMLRRPYPRTPLLMPLAWSLFATSAAWQLGMAEDYTLLLAFATACWLFARAGIAPRPSTEGTPAALELLRR
jgi:hypothetical protein